MFTKTEQQAKLFDRYLKKIDDIVIKIKTFDEGKNELLNDLIKTKGNFVKKTDDFYREDRKLRIAVIGQVKAGKSSFLNTLLFDGKDILPRAATPKTANLTKINYSEKNYLTIEFYTKAEWNELEELANKNLETDEVKVAKEIMKMVSNLSLNVNEYIGNNNYVINFDSYEELINRLNDYAGENGKLTPLVKSIQMYVNNENLKAIEIVDTPGMNDPILSRTDKTKQFIELCDVVFFLSRSSKFLDKSDMDLLSRQLPQKGVSKMILIASQYDSVINDVIWDLKDYNKAKRTTAQKLKERAEKEFTELIKNMEIRGADSKLLNVVEKCKKPILVSSMAHNMSKKEHAFYTEEELLIYNEISGYCNLDKTELNLLGNFDEVISTFKEVINSKDETLFEKSKTFIPASGNEITSLIGDYKLKIEKRVKTLTESGLDELGKKKKETLSKKNNIQADVEIIFGNLILSLDKGKTELLSQLRRTISDYSKVSERTGTEERTGSREVSSSKWWNPFSWGSTRTEYYTYTATYTYLDVADAVESIRNYVNEAISAIEGKLNDTIDFSSSKRELLKMVLRHFDTTDENFDPSYFRLLVEKSLNNIEIPIIKIDASSQIAGITSKFKGELRDGGTKSEMLTTVNSILHNIFENIQTITVSEIGKIKAEIVNIKETITPKMLEEIVKEIEIIEAQFKDKQKQLEHNKGIITLLNECSELIKN